ncbi:hypothetical protein GOY07_03475 [Wolbachia endosymbiont of Litomosoides sigmodontis]|uniref:hypothetical protein n=1 Tax=Wolbachia endosymbiont of Litomosoides sigmodontis TaxID=80850 RepID=UPI00158B1BB3|nr:hypothetical protein [Wolbachia endosymbiont of Litomosoides sigmodontis]QKX03209.1 hypothetical protein GOY07_03475 [Wolbachia endosymbiont of Litomosoides sigmodontis]
MRITFYVGMCFFATIVAKSGKKRRKARLAGYKPKVFRNIEFVVIMIPTIQRINDNNGKEDLLK